MLLHFGARHLKGENMDLTGHAVILTGQDPVDKNKVAFTVDGNAMSVTISDDIVGDEAAILKFINQSASDWLDAQATKVAQAAAEAAAATSVDQKTVDLTPLVGHDITDPTVS